MALGMDVTVAGHSRLATRLDRMDDRLVDLRRPLRQEVAPRLRLRAKDAFRTKGQSHGSPWAPLAPSTLRAKARGWGYYRRGAGGGTLRARGQLQKSYTRKSSHKHVEDITRFGMEWGSKHPLAHLHAQGPSSRGPAPPLPSRPVIGFRNAFERYKVVVEPIEDHVLGPFRRGI